MKTHKSILVLVEKILSDVVPRCEQCKAVVKPDAVFFGKSLPERFRLVEEDFPNCDLLIILGTSLVVQPFASLVDRYKQTSHVFYGRY